MKKVLLCGTLFLLMMSGMANATLTVIGTATYDDGTGSAAYNLIWDDNNNGSSVVWLDYTKVVWTDPELGADWDIIMDWAAGLGDDLTINLYAGYSVDWDDAWRLPETFMTTGWGGFTILNSEIGDLYYTELGNVAYAGLTSTGDFQNLSADAWYWLTPEVDAATAWGFWTGNGVQSSYAKDNDGYDGSEGLALINADVTFTAAPVPAAAWLFASGLIGLVGIRRRSNK